jgi:hypothetical protein
MITTTALARDVLAHMTRPNLGVILYGSQARGTSRYDSDIDVLEIVERAPHSYSIGQMNVTAYTAQHLSTLASRGSLFVRHLVDEGMVLADPAGLVAETLRAYVEPKSYEPLKLELRLLLKAITSPDAAQYRPLLDNLAKFTVRSALYIRGAESSHLAFDLERAASQAGAAGLAATLRSPVLRDLADLVEAGVRLLDTPLPDGVPSSMHSIAIWSASRYPLVAGQLEQTIAGNAKINYSLLTLPPS